MTERSGVPDEPPALLPGRSASYWLLRAGLSIFGLVALLFVAVAPVLVAGPDGRSWTIGLLAVFVACGVFSFILGIMAIRAQLREQRHGYTTLYSASGRRYWQLDPKTGEVLRRPGEAEARRPARKKGS